MNVLYLGYWGINEGLSQSTILPHLKILESFSEVEQIIYVSIEREDQEKYQIAEFTKVTHIPFKSRHTYFRFLNKLTDVIHLTNFIVGLVKEYDIDLLMCRSSMAGSIGYRVHTKIGIPYTVESFEPHAEYMLESGIWSQWGISYLLQSYWENMQKRSADALIPVSFNYKKYLIDHGCKQPIYVMPCVVDLDLFEFNEKDRIHIREDLNIPSDALVGIYVGKFGGLYYDKEAFDLYKKIMDEFDNLYIIILSPEDTKQIRADLQTALVNLDLIRIKSVSYSEVPAYLSASDFAFATYKPGFSKQFLSPIKIGEYWANGLEVVLTEGIGDETDIIRKEGGGVLINQEKDLSLKLDFGQLKELLTAGERDNRLAKKYRSIEIVRDTYKEIVRNREL